MLVLATTAGPQLEQQQSAHVTVLRSQAHIRRDELKGGDSYSARYLNSSSVLKSIL